MPMTQTDIRNHYEAHWSSLDEQAICEKPPCSCDGVEEPVIAPIYQQLVRDLRTSVDGGSILDVGCGSGRWLRCFLQWFHPALVVGIDCTRSSVDLLQRSQRDIPGCELEFRTADITAADLDLGREFDLVNVGNVLFHIPEQDLFMRALHNLAALVTPRGHIITTEYLPRTTMRTEWMLVRSRYEFEAAAAAVGLRIVDVRAFGFFANDPMGLDGPDNGVRQHFNEVRAYIKQIRSSNLDDQSRQFMSAFLVSIEQALLAFCKERVPDIDLPSQKLVALTRVS